MQPEWRNWGKALSPSKFVPTTRLYPTAYVFPQPTKKKKDSRGRGLQKCTFSAAKPKVQVGDKSNEAGNEQCRENCKRRKVNGLAPSQTERQKGPSFCFLPRVIKHEKERCWRSGGTIPDQARQVSQLRAQLLPSLSVPYARNRQAWEGKKEGCWVF